MTSVALILVGIVGFLHVLFGLAEMLFWPRLAKRLLGISEARDLRLTSGLAFNQGLYNLFIAAGLFWAVLMYSEPVANAFLVFVVVAGIVGAITASARIFWVQAMPAIVALAVIMI